MAVIALTSAKGAPGVTTTAVGLTLMWPRPALLVEADVAGSSSILAGTLNARINHSRGLVGLTLAQRHGPLTADTIWQQTLELAPERLLLPGIATPAQAATMTTTWGPLADVLRSLERVGVDVIIDAGRLGTLHAPAPLLHGADLVLLTTGTHLPDIAAARTQVPALAQTLAASGSGADALRLLVVGTDRPYTARDRKPYTAREIAGALELPNPLHLPWDAVTAEVLALGATRGRRFDTAPLTRALQATTTQLMTAATHRRTHLEPAPEHAMTLGER